MSAPQTPQAQTHHYTPPWLDWIATHIVPSAMIGAEMVIVTLFFIVTSVRQPYNPLAWSYLEAALVFVAACVGLAMAGLALKLSGMAAEMLATGHALRGAFTFAGVLILALIETWAGIVERAQTIGIGQADILLADYTGIAAFKSIPTSVFMVAFILPCLVLWYGWASRPPVTISAEQQALTHAAKLAQARFKAEMRAIQAGGLARAGVAFKNGITGRQTEEIPPDTQDGLAPEAGAPIGDNVVTFPGPKRAAKKTGLQWTASDLQAYIRATYGQEFDDTSAAFRIRVLGKEKRLDGVAGRPYYANNKTAKAWADGEYRAKEIAD
jgi:hypothetical protein